MLTPKPQTYQLHPSLREHYKGGERIRAGGRGRLVQYDFFPLGIEWLLHDCLRIETTWPGNLGK